MAAPILTSAVVRKELPAEVLLYFDQALDTDVTVPLSSFLINFGKFQINSSEYTSNAILKLTLTPQITVADELFFTYEPPTNLNQVLRAPVRNISNQTQLKAAAVRPISNFEILNLLTSDELSGRWNSSSNVSGDGATVANYPIQRRGEAVDPTPDDFILMYGLKEAIQISNIDDASATKPNYARIWMALQDAAAWIDSYVTQVGKACTFIVSSNRRRTACIIARYYLDTVRRRKDVTEDYERCLKEIQDTCDSFNGGGTDPTDPPASEAGGILRTWRIPQMYNPVTGKGYSGWWTDSAADIECDKRDDVSYYGAESNLSDDCKGTKNPTSRPTDGGGSSTGTDP